MGRDGFCQNLVELGCGVLELILGLFLQMGRSGFCGTLVELGMWVLANGCQ